MNIYSEIIGCRFNLIKTILFKKNSLSKKELEEVKEKIILIDKIIKAYRNNEKIIFDQSLFSVENKIKEKTR